MSAAIEKKDIDLIHAEVKALREEAEKARPDLEKLDKLHTRLDEAETKNQELMTRVNEETALKSEVAELKESLDSGEAEFKGQIETFTNRIAELEAEQAKNAGRSPDSSEDEWKSSDEYAATTDYFRFGNEMEQKSREIIEKGKAEYKDLMRTDTGPVGGYLTHVELDRQMIKLVHEVSPIRSLASIRSTGSKSMRIVIRDTIPEAFFEGESEAVQQGNPTWDEDEMFTFRLGIQLQVTLDQLMNSEFSMESDLFSDTSLGMAQKEGIKFVLGTGHKQPEGFLVDSRMVGTGIPRDTAVVGAIDADSILLLQGDLKKGYNPGFGLNRKTLATLRTLKGTTNDHYLWSPALDGGVTNMLAGSPYTVIPDMPDIALGSFPLIYADWPRMYRILDRTGMAVVRDELTAADQAIVKFTFHKWLNGQVVNPEAGIVLRVLPS